MRTQSPRPTIYAEPFAGGAGAALRLLIDEQVRSVRINDLSPGIAAFWRCVFYDTERFARQVETAVVDLEHWEQARQVFQSPSDRTDLELGFATFFLNRCNRSGILTARPIGGMNQTGKWKIDARFNRVDLAERVRRLGQYRRRVEVSQLDGRDFMKTLEHLGQDAFAYVDPPYIVQGEGLYLDSLSPDDHRLLAEQLRESPTPWMLTYDVSERITEELYSGLRMARFNIAHTAQRQHIGTEIVVFSERLYVDSIRLLKAANASWVSA
ncbi:DNA adenine methylase [Dermabacteraceae bacterium TAE3-ERU5]|nr:DNA adenine methylase [Dermabacteraceae bacterium TAE3-ERU5]